VLRPVFPKPFEYQAFPVSPEQSTQHGRNTAVSFFVLRIEKPASVPTTEAMMTPVDQTAADRLALEIALTEMVRFLCGQVLFHKDRDQFRSNLRLAEEAITRSLESRTLWPPDKANPEHEAYIREGAAAFVTKLLVSIQHPSDAAESAARKGPPA
jgi:hypothetical protein